MCVLRLRLMLQGTVQVTVVGPDLKAGASRACVGRCSQENGPSPCSPEWHWQLTQATTPKSRRASPPAQPAANPALIEVNLPRPARPRHPGLWEQAGMTAQVPVVVQQQPSPDMLLFQPDASLDSVVLLGTLAAVTDVARFCSEVGALIVTEWDD